MARTVVLYAMVAVAVLGGGAVGLHKLRKHVEQKHAFPPHPPTVTIRNRPAWMSDALALQIARAVRPHGARSAMDHQLLKDIAEVLSHNPWVRQVRQVRRAYGQAPGDIIEIDCEFRAPIALVPYRNEYILVDGEGHKLPERFPITQQPPRVLFGSDGRVNIRIIEGVAAMPPYVDGQRWAGEDLQAGLDMVKLLYDQPFAEEIHRVNVANYKGRRNPREAQIALITRYRTEIRWGEPVKLAFHAEVSPSEKLQRLATLHQRYGRVDCGHPWIDIRLDRIMYPSEDRPLARGYEPANGTN